MGKILFTAFAVKMVGSLVRYAVTFEVYTGRADAGGYHGSGARLAAAFWDGTGTASSRRGARARRHRVHPADHRGGVRRDRPDQARRVHALRLARILGALLLLPGVPDRGPRGRSPAVRARCSSSCRRCCTGPRASARKRGCSSPSASSPSAQPGLHLRAARVPRPGRRARRHGRRRPHITCSRSAPVPRHPATPALVAGVPARPARPHHRPRRDDRDRAVVDDRAASFFNVGDVPISSESVDTVLDRTNDQSSTGGSESKRPD